MKPEKYKIYFNRFNHYLRYIYINDYMVLFSFDKRLNSIDYRYFSIFSGYEGTIDSEKNKNLPDNKLLYYYLISLIPSEVQNAIFSRS